GCRLLRSGRLDEALEVLEVELALPDGDHVAGRARHDRVPSDDLAELRYVHLQRGCGRLRRRGAPEPVDQPIPGDHLTGGEQKYRQKLALLRACEDGRPAVLQQLQPPEDTELHDSLSPPLGAL